MAHGSALLASVWEDWWHRCHSEGSSQTSLGVYYNRNIEFGTNLWNEFKQFVLAKKTQIPSTRFWSVLLNVIYSKILSISKDESDEVYKAPTLRKHATNPKCPHPLDGFQITTCVLQE